MLVPLGKFQHFFPARIPLLKSNLKNKLIPQIFGGPGRNARGQINLQEGLGHRLLVHIKSLLMLPHKIDGQSVQYCAPEAGS